jgi:hypothetical protein
MHVENGLVLHVQDAQGCGVGSLGNVYVDEETGRPILVSVRAATPGGEEHVAPLQGAIGAGDTVVLRVSKNRVDGAPELGPRSDLGAAQDVVDDYYGDHLAADPQE